MGIPGLGDIRPEKKSDQQDLPIARLVPWAVGARAAVIMPAIAIAALVTIPIPMIPVAVAVSIVVTVMARVSIVAVVAAVVVVAIIPPVTPVVMARAVMAAVPIMAPVGRDMMGAGPGFGRRGVVANRGPVIVIRDRGTHDGAQESPHHGPFPAVDHVADDRAGPGTQQQTGKLVVGRPGRGAAQGNQADQEKTRDCVPGFHDSLHRLTTVPGYAGDVPKELPGGKHVFRVVTVGVPPGRYHGVMFGRLTEVMGFTPLLRPLATGRGERGVAKRTGASR